MHIIKFLTPLLLLLSPALTSPLPLPISSVGDIQLESRQSCYATCGSVCYYSSTINNAVSDGYGRYRSGSMAGGYPHTYNNYEGFDFGVNGPYQEYPVLSSFKAYSGGSPGPDRVIFNTGGALAGVITHTGASGNSFVACN